MGKLTIVLGNKNYSSWSLRAALVLDHTGAPYEEIVVQLDQPETAAQIRRHSPSGRVPALIDGDLVVWDSLAIAEYLAEKFPAAQLWPGDTRARARARSVSAEMHAGFADLRTSMPMNMRRSAPGRGHTAGALADAARIQGLWRDCRATFGNAGPFLFGRFSIADAMYAPVVSRFVTYGVPLEGAARDYAEAVQAWPAYRRWLEAARAEPWASPKYDQV
jgi:glutathione S-transferase